MASFLLPSSIQKRLLRYALSRLELLDTDALNLENLDISWGTKSTLEFRDVGLRLKKLSNLLKLSPKIDLVKARILLLRITIPVDIYSSPIVVEVEGVEAHVRVVSGLGGGNKHHKSPKGPGKEQNKQDARAKKSIIADFETTKGKEKNSDAELPTATDLAISFLQTEPIEEKAELEAAISSQSHILTTSLVYSEDGEDDYAMGTGTGLSLPSFMATFLKGIVDRLQVRVRGISLDMDVDVSSETVGRPATPSSTDTVTLQLKIDDVDIEGVTFRDNDTSKHDDKDASIPRVIHKDGKRQISLSKLRGALISDPSLFASMARSSVFSSPGTTYSPLSETRQGHSAPSSVHQTGFVKTTEKDSIHTIDPRSTEVTNSHHSLSSSVIASDSGRFEDAPEDDENPKYYKSSHIVSSALSNITLDQSAYSDQVMDSQFLDRPDDDEEEEEEDPPFALADDHVRDYSDIKAGRSAILNPRASFYGQPSLDQYPSPQGSSPSNSKNAQTMFPSALPTRPRPKSVGRSTSESRILHHGKALFGEKKAQNSVDGSPSGGSSSGSDEISDIEDSTPLGEEDLAQSMIFSHEDAESMYMSALSQGSTSTRIPGAWDPATSGADEPNSSLRSPPLQKSQHGFSDNLENALQDAVSRITFEQPLISEESMASSNVDVSSSGSGLGDVSPMLDESQNTTATSKNGLGTSKISSQSSASSDEYIRVAKQIFNLDQVTIYLPSDDARATNDLMAHERDEISTSTYDGHADIAYSVSPDVPGAFSVYSARIRGNQSRTATIAEKPPMAIVKDNQNLLEVTLGKFHVQFDISVSRLMTRFLLAISDVMTTNKPNSDALEETAEMSSFALKFRADRISLKFLERLAATSVSADPKVVDTTWIKPPSTDVLLRTTIKGLDIRFDVSKAMKKAAFKLQKFVFGYAKENIVSFDAGLRMRASTRDLGLATGLDVAFDAVLTPASSKVKIETLPIHVSIDLRRLDETFSWFGGLSSVLNMGSSMASNATVTAASPSKPVNRSRVVRFEGSTNSDHDSFPGQSKVEARIGGFVLDLVGKECTVGMDTTAVKIINRDELLALSIDQIKVSGPHLHLSSREPAILAELNVTRVEFLATPKNDDLDRLLSLITPSKAKYDRDDDILLDTLLRQRRQGSLLRIKVDSFKTRVSNMEDLKYLPELGEEVSRLSSVAKYLPEDDRPGLLTLLLVHDFDVKVDVNDTLGSLQLHAADFEAAQIAFPALLALSINAINIHRNGKEELLGAATDVELREPKNRSPAVMARMIGDEMEPVMKIKFWNLKVEYSVPLLVAILDLSGTIIAEEVAASVALSIATLTDLSRPAAVMGLQNDNAQNKDFKNPDSKAMVIDIGLRECLLGLNPSDMPAKVLLVMTEAHVEVVLPKDHITSAIIDMSKGSLLVIDDTANIAPAGASKTRRQSFDGGSNQVADLCSAGFVSVSYISSAKVVVHITGAEDGDENFIDVELRDDLLVLESCADSTQTLLAALNALKLPTPPSQEVKYRTKVIPVQDLLASLSGDAFGTAEGNYDFDEDFGPDLHKSASSTADDDETSELDFDSHYYQERESIKSHHENEDYEESRQGSVIFDQLQSHDTNDGVLLESFREQEQVHVAEELNFKEDHFSVGSVIEGTAHRWNSAKNTYDRSNDQKIRKGPLKVCIRDVHIIWNLFDGYDWQHTRDAITKAVQDVESKAIEQRARNDRRPTFDLDVDEEETVIGDFLFNSIYIGIPANRDPRELAMAINQELNDNATETESIATTSHSASPSRQGIVPRNRGKRLRLRRSKHHKITFELKGVNVDLVVFPPGSGETESSIDVRVHDFDIFDHVPTSTWKKFATYMHDAGERESGTSQIHLEILNVRPIPELAASEIVLKATVLPLRLHVDQDALDFITRFFEFKDDSAPAQTSQGDVPFLQRVEVNSIPVKLDFKPKRVDYAGLRSGHTTEFMNFIVLDEADMVLRHTIIYGISGFDKLGKCLNDIWMPDIKRNQLPGILAGLAPVRSLANVGGGMRDLVVVPMREYRKDGRVVRSISKGAFAFARTTGTELVKLGAKLAIGTQTVLQGAEEFLSRSPTRDPSSAAWDDELDEEEKKQISLYADQPIGVVQGLRGGYKSLERDLLMARDAIIAVPGEIMESGTAGGAARAVLRRAPTVILRPVIGASKAIGQTLMGATNSLDPQNRRRIEDKYKKH